MRFVFVLFGLSAALIGAVWAWLGQPVALPQVSGLAGKLYCVSYAPYRGDQTPFDEALHITAGQIDEDLARLAKIAGCVRTYATGQGLEQVAEIAGRHGLKVLQGLWVSDHPLKTKLQVDSVVQLANRYPHVIEGVIVGNEVLLRGEMLAADLAQLIRDVKGRIRVPVTYADVWEYWLRNPEVAGAVDFITIHILPYWEDLPIAARDAGAHVAAIRSQVAAAFAGKEILIGEFGWPSAGRMREGALPSPVNQARVIQEALARAQSGNYRVNIIEAFDQPWKRALEGTVGGHWGILDGTTREAKFHGGKPLSNHPHWPWQALGGILFALAIFACARAFARGAVAASTWFGVVASASVGGILFGWIVADMPLVSFGVAGWTRSLAFTAVALLTPVFGVAAMTSGTALPRFDEIVGPVSRRIRGALARTYGALLILTTVLAIMVALGLVFDPRYRDFPFAAFSVAATPFVLHRALTRREQGPRPPAEIAVAALLLCSSLYVAVNETFANWQSVWLCAVFVVFAATLAQARGAQN